MDYSTYEDANLKTTMKLCSIDTYGIISSVYSNDYPVKFYKGSFVFHFIDNLLMIYTHPMFIWRLIFFNKNLVDIEHIFDFHKLTLFVQQLGTELYLTQNEVEYTLDGVLIYKPAAQLFCLLYTSYSQLYISIQRGYDQIEPVKRLFDCYIILLRHISNT